MNPRWPYLKSKFLSFLLHVVGNGDGRYKIQFLQIEVSLWR